MKKIISFLFPFFLIVACAGSPINQTTIPVEFTDANFQKSVLDSKGITVIEFWAEWCGPCRMVDPIITELANDYGKKVNIGKMNVDLEPKITKQLGIRSIPTILIFKDGEVVDKHVGLLTKRALEKKIDELL